MTDFSLIPFDLSTAPKLKISGTITRQHDQIQLKYLLAGNLATIIIPPSTPNPTRQFDLWEHTCFELFLKLKNTTKYWEFNLAPTGDWNVFRFPNYRQDITEEMAFEFLPFSVSRQNDLLQLDLTINLEQIIATEDNLAVNITSVIKNQEQQLSYWALSHPTVADFHHPESFMIDLS